jgi:hypothetical protein
MIAALLGRVIETARHLVRIQRVRGQPFFIQGRQFVPVSQVIRIGGLGPAGGGGIVWNRPVTLTEVIGEGIYRHYAIPDVTRQAIVRIALCALLVRFGLSLLFRRRT